MKGLFKRLSILTASLAMVFGVGLVNNEKKAKADATIYKQTIFSAKNNSAGNSSYTETFENTTNGFTVTVANGNNNNNGWDGHVRFGRKKVTSKGAIMTKEIIDKKITRVDLTIGSKCSNVNAINVYADTNSSPTTLIGTFTGYGTNKTISLDVSTKTATNLFYKIEFDMSSASSGNGTLDIGQVDFYIEESTNPNQSKISLDESSKILKIRDVLALSATTSGEGTTVAWESSATEVASVVNGVVTANKTGTATITATFGTATATCKILVTDHDGKENDPYSVSDIRNVIDFNVPSEAVYIKGIIANYSKPTDAELTKYGNITFDISDDGMAENVFKAYQVNYLKDEVFTSTDQVAVGDTVVLYGQVVLYSGNIYETVGKGAAYVYSHTPKVTRTLKDLSLSGALTKTKYTTDDTFSPDGLTITANYSDGSTKDVTKDVTWPALTAGMTSITGTYEDKTIEVTGITVTQATVSYTLTIKLDVETIYENTDGTLSYELKDNKGNDFDGKITLIVWSSINENALVFIDSSTGEYLAGDAGTTTIDLLVYTDNTSVYFNASLELEVKVAPTYMVDKITADDLKATSTTYTNFENLSFTSGVSYSGNNSKDGNSYIQMRADKDKQGNYSGIISTKAKMIASKIEIEWGSKKSSNNKNKTINVYGSNVPFSSTSDLYNTSLKPIKQITYDGTSTTSTLDLLNDEKITSKYAYIGIRSSGGTLYLASVSFTWERSSNAEGFIEMWNEMRAKGTKGICNYLNGSQTPNELDELLDTYYNDETLTDADKAIINDAEDGENNTIGNSITFIEAYKASHTSNGANANNSITKVSKNNIAFILIIGFLGLTSVVGYYLIQKRRLSK